MSVHQRYSIRTLAQSLFLLGRSFPELNFSVYNFRDTASLSVWCVPFGFFSSFFFSTFFYIMAKTKWSVLKRDYQLGSFIFQAGRRFFFSSIIHYHTPHRIGVLC